MINWANEPFVRLFKRNTDDDLLLSWEARAIWYEFLKQCDNGGLIETKRGVRGLAAMIRIPFDVVDKFLPELLEDGRLVARDGVGYDARNYSQANYTPRAPGSRMADVRIRERIGIASQSVTSRNGTSQSVTSRNGASHNVTNGDAEEQLFPLQIRSEQIRTGHVSRATRATRTRSALPVDWGPREAECELARSLGLDVDRESAEFKSYWLAEGKPKKDWDLAFAHRLRQQAEFRTERNGESHRDEVREIPEL